MQVRQIALAAALLLGTVALAGCDRAMSNMQTIISNDCGRTWELIEVGDTVPGRLAPCDLKVTIPNYPMAGESNFRGTFANRVRVNVNASYDYTIVDPLLFIREARFVGRQNSSGDAPENAAAVWDTAENIVIDRRLRDLANSDEFLLTQDVVDFNQGEFEERLQEAINRVLAERGVQLNSLTFVVTPDDQTRNMIDVAAADRVCATIENMSRTECREIIQARAGAPRVVVTTQDEQN